MLGLSKLIEIFYVNRSICCISLLGHTEQNRVDAMLCFETDRNCLKN